MEQFHGDCYGKFVELTENRTSATRKKDYFYGTVFGALPLKPFQPVSVEITLAEEGLDGRLRYGFTNCDPSGIFLDPKNPYFMTELLNTKKYSARKLPYEMSHVGHSISYYYTPKQNVFVSFDGAPSVETNRRDWRGAVDFSKPVWPMLDLYASTKGIKIVPAPPEILAHGPEAIAAFREATLAGTKRVYRTRLMFVGQERVGKTSLKKNLVRESFCDTEVSTEGIDVCRVAINPYVKRANVERWQSQEGHEFEDIQSSYDFGVAENMAIIKECESPQQSQSPTVDSSNLEAPQYVHHDEESSPQTSFEFFKEDATSVEDTKQPQITPAAFPSSKRTKLNLKLEIPKKSIYTEDTDVRNLTDHDIDEVPASVINALFKEQTEDQDLKMGLWDFAGQDLYYTTHQVFLSRKAVYVVVFDMSKELDEPAEIALHCINPGAVTESKLGRSYSYCGHHHELTCLEFLDFWMRSIYTFTIPNQCKEDEIDQLSPPVFIVGTHKNDLHDDPNTRNQMVKEKLSTISKFVARQCYRKHIVSKYYAVENSLDHDQDEEVCILRDHIESVARNEPYMGERIPLRWLLFQKQVQQIARKGEPCITLEEAKTIYSNLPGAPQQISSEEEMLTMLEFYHDIGQIVYIKSGGEDLRNLVILDPNWLIDVFKDVVSVVDVDRKRAIDIDSWTRLKEHAILDERLVTHLWSHFLKCKTAREANTKKNALLELMSKFDLLCEKDSPKSLHPHPKCYYVPSRLQPESNQPVMMKCKEETKPSRIFYINFHGFLPDGFFHRIMVRAAKWSQEQGGPEPDLQYRKVTVYADDYHECVLEMSTAKEARITVFVAPVDLVNMPHTTGIEVHRRLKKACNKVKEFLEHTLHDLKEIWAKRIEYSFCLACQCGVGNIHLLSFQDCMNREVVSCEYRKRTHTVKLKEQFSLEEKKGKSGDGNLLLEDAMADDFLLELAERVGKEWRGLATRLQFSTAKIDHLVSDQVYAIDRIHAMLVSWRQKQDQSDIEGAIKKLVDALSACGREDLVQYIQENIKRN